MANSWFKCWLCHLWPLDLEKVNLLEPLFIRRKEMTKASYQSTVVMVGNDVVSTESFLNHKA